MKIGSKGFYGILAMAELVRTRNAGKPVQVKDIAQRQRIPVEFLGHIMVLLKRADLVRSHRGPGGGYHLAHPPETISVGTVLQALEGPLMDPEVKGKRKGPPVSVVARRLLESWGRAVQASEKILEEVTLADLCRPEEGNQMYYI
jgi:Rrf2 family protein